MQLLQSMVEHRIAHIIFSSSAAVYGNPVAIPMTETHQKQPLSPYGKTKYMVEEIIADFAQAYDMSGISLRYFNAAGAQPDDGLGEMHEPETHLIPKLLTAMAAQKPCVLYGDDYPTPDGSCVRDFLHVTDIAQAHIRALDHLRRGGPSDQFNLGTGVGYSVKQVVKAIEQLFGITLKVSWAKRRAGDPEVLVADASKAQRILNWHPRYSSLEHILLSAYAFMGKQRERQEFLR
jgi:UDP-glucose 4-epimerase